MGAISPNRPERGGAADALRFLAAAFVVLYHYGADAPVPLERLAPVFGRGWLATDFFLLLSGYVLGRAYGAGLDAGRWDVPAFVLRRLRRIWPAHVVVLIGFALLVWASALVGIAPAHPERFDAETFWLQAALVHAWGFTVQSGWNTPSWTLSALVVCYLAFPFAWRAARPLRGRASAVAAALALPAAAAALSLLALDRPLYDLPFQYGVIRALPLFLAGALLARFREGREAGRGQAAALAAGAGLVLLLTAAAPRSGVADFGAVVALGALVLAADTRLAPASRTAAAAAAVSFALFVTHALAGAVWFGAARLLAARVEPGGVAAWALWAGALPFALAFAYAFHRWIDAPLQARLAGLRPRRAPGPAPAPSG